jgi:hypothetical protein
MSKNGKSTCQRAERSPVRTDVEFYVGDAIMKAISINVSESGLCFDMDEPIKICLRMEVNNQLINREAQIVWAKKKSDGGVTYGFEFTPNSNCW